MIEFTGVLPYEMGRIFRAQHEWVVAIVLTTSSRISINPLSMSGLFLE